MTKKTKSYVAPGHYASRICFLGAVEGRVTGSLHLVELLENGKVTRGLIDVGQTMENPKADFDNWLLNGLTVADINFIIITHCHLDHAGLLPRLYKLGFRGKVYVTPATGDLLEISLVDSGKIQEADARRENKRAARRASELAAQEAERKEVRLQAADGPKQTPVAKARKVAKPKVVEPLYTVMDALECLKLFKRKSFLQRVQVVPGLCPSFRPRQPHPGCGDGVSGAGSEW